MISRQHLLISFDLKHVVEVGKQEIHYKVCGVTAPRGKSTEKRFLHCENTRHGSFYKNPRSAGDKKSSNLLESVPKRIILL